MAPEKRPRTYEKNSPPGGLPNPLPGTNVLVDDPKIRKRLHLDEPESFYKKWRKTVPIHSLPTRPVNERIPKLDYFALEEGTHPRVEEFIKTRKGLLGTAGGRKQEIREVVYMRSDEWAHIVEPDQSACIINSDTGDIEAYVIRNLFNDKGITNTFNETSKRHSFIAKDVRDGDLGQMCLYGYSAGSRHRPSFIVARNLEKMATYSDQEKRLHHHSIMSAHTLIWNKARKFLPSSIIQPMEEEMDREGCPRADWGSYGDPNFKPVVSFTSHGKHHELTKGLELGVHSGVCTSVYARGCHLEQSPKTAPYVISYTTKRDPGWIGGNFYIPHIGLLIRAATDTLIVHRADVLHGTTVHNVDFRDVKLEHRGFSMYCRKGLPDLWRTRQRILEGTMYYDKKGRSMMTDELVATLSPEAAKRYRMKLASRQSREEEDSQDERISDSSEEDVDIELEEGGSPDEEYCPTVAIRKGKGKGQDEIVVEVRKRLRKRQSNKRYVEDESDDEMEEAVPVKVQVQNKKQAKKSIVIKTSTPSRRSNETQANDSVVVNATAPATKGISTGRVTKKQAKSPVVVKVRPGLRQRRVEVRYA